MELRHMRSFVAVAEELHFGRAAERLHLAQPALSRQIQNLEQDLGVLLFFRTKRRVQLTDAGAVFLDQVRSVFNCVDEAIQAAQRGARGQSGWLEIGFVGSATYDVLPAAINAFRQQFPQVELRLAQMTTTEQVAALHEKRIHVGFLRPPVWGEGLALETIAREPLVVVLPSKHRLTKRRSIPLKALAGERFVLFPNRPTLSWADYIVAVCQRAGFEPQVVQRTMEIQTAISLVSAGVGITLAAASVENIRRRGVVYRRLSGTAPKTELIAAYRPDDPSPVLASFLAVMRATVKKIR